jgi:lethal(2) giant larvae protein
MFKFATNKFSNHHHNSNANNNNNSVTSVPNSNSQTHAQNHNFLTNTLLKHHGSDDASSSSRRRYQIQKDLFSFNKIADKGFPSKPSAMDYDRKLKLLAIGTKNGDIRIYGEPNTPTQQLSCYQDVHPFPIMRILFIQGQYQLITLSERVYRNDMTNKGESQLFLVLWQIPNFHENQQASNLIEKVKEYQLDPKFVNNTRISAITLLNDNSHLFIGLETGDVYVFNVASFQLVPGVINKDYILKNIPQIEGGKKLTSLGAVESISHHPRQLTKLLIAYTRGLWIIFDFIKNHIDQINQTQQQLESAVFYQYGECVATSHSDGSFILWDLTTTAATIENKKEDSTTTNKPSSCTSYSAPNIVYGPYPCKSVTKCIVKTCRNDQPYVIFSGGCPRVNYSDKITISVIQGENSHVCFDFTSKIIDFFTIDRPHSEKTGSTPSTTSLTDNPQALFVLLEEEFVAIDLVSENWPQYRLPYLCSVHSSAIICTHYVNNVSKDFYDRLKSYGTLCQDPSELYSEREWPIKHHHQSTQNEDTLLQQQTSFDLLLTGHEDGSVRFWDVTNMTMTLIYRLKTADYFQTDSTPLDDQSGLDSSNLNEDNWPPFRKVGTFDPYSDDPKLGIQKIHLCSMREVLVIAGTAGQVLILSLNDQARDVAFNSIQAHKINIIGVSPEVETHFVWKGHEPLPTRGYGTQNKDNGVLKLLPGYQLHALIQLYPPATVSALALNTDWQLVGMGTSHGFALYDYCHMKDLLIRCTLDLSMLINPNDSGNGGTISRRKSLKKSLRESFRKLRRGRSQKPNANKTIKLNSNPMSASMRGNPQNEIDDLNDLHRPIERQVESREFKPMDDIPPSVIRYMYFVRTYITNSQQMTNSLWVGTNTGIIYIYALQFLLNSSNVGPNMSGIRSTTTLRSNQSINCLLAKEMRLKHRAPVVHIQVIDQNMTPLPTESNSAQNNLPQITGAHQNDSQLPNHKVIICSEEQFKVFQLPTLKPVCKFKLTAVEGARVRRIGYNSYISKSDSKYSEFCLSCLSNLGDISIYSLPQLKRQVQIQCMKQQDINAITSFVFSKLGQAFYLQSPSEFVHISLSARDSPQKFMIKSQSKQQQQEKTTTQQNNSNTNKSNANPTTSSSSSSKTIDPKKNNNSNNNATSSSSSANSTNVQNQQGSVPVPAPRSALNSLTGLDQPVTNSR